MGKSDQDQEQQHQRQGIGNIAGTGVDITKALGAKGENGVSSLPRSSRAKQSRGKKKKREPKGKVVLLSRGKSTTHENGNIDDIASSSCNSLEAETSQTPIKHQFGNVQATAMSDLKGELSITKQKLFEATRDLEKEKNTREMLQNKISSLGLELKNVKEQLGEKDRNCCVSTLKEELEFEQKLRLSVQSDLTKSHEIIVLEQKRMNQLEQEIKTKTKAIEFAQIKLQAAKEELNSQRTFQRAVEEQLSLEKQKNLVIQTRLQNEAAANVAIRMELQSVKVKKERVEELEEQLKQERCATGQYKVEAAECDAMRKELEKLRSVKEDDILRKLRRELHETRLKLKNERRKSVASMQCPKRPFSDLVVAPTNRNQHSGLIPVQSPSSVNLPRPIEASLPRSRAPSSPPSSSLSSLFHFDDDDVSMVCDEALEPLHDELTFIRSAYDPDEIVIEENKVTHFIELSSLNKTQTILIALSLTIPTDYPAEGVLDVKANIHCSNCEQEVRKCAIDSLPDLQEMCTWEAKANKGRAAIHSIFSLASGWALTDWHNILSKELPHSKDKAGESNDIFIDICVSLMHTHHIVDVDAEKIQYVKKNASKLSLGGYIKLGKPGIVLVEGAEADCDSFLTCIAQDKKIFHSSSFRIGGKILRKVPNTECCRCLPRKITMSGMDEMKTVCEKLGLGAPLADILRLR